MWGASRSSVLSGRNSKFRMILVAACGSFTSTSGNGRQTPQSVDCRHSVRNCEPRKSSRDGRWRGPNEKSLPPMLVQKDLPPKRTQRCEYTTVAALLNNGVVKIVAMPPIVSPSAPLLTSPSHKQRERISGTSMLWGKRRLNAPEVYRLTVLV